MYNVLLVEWNKDHQIVYRIGLGRIFKAAWEASGPLTQFVTLGQLWTDIDHDLDNMLGKVKKSSA